MSDGNMIGANTFLFRHCRGAVVPGIGIVLNIDTQPQLGSTESEAPSLSVLVPLAQARILAERILGSLDIAEKYSAPPPGPLH